MRAQKIADAARVKSAELGKVMPSKDGGQDATHGFDEIMGKCKANIKAIDLLDEDQKEYLSRNAKVFLAAQRKKMKGRLKK